MMVPGAETTMTVTIDLAPELEARLRDEAARQGLDPSVLVRRALEERLRAAGANGANGPSPLSAEESKLLQNINLGLSQATWQRYHELVGKRRAEALGPQEHDELGTLTHQIEEANARRLGHLVQLARLRGATLDEVVRDLGISPGPADGHV
jgi:hypothetical protein